MTIFGNCATILLNSAIYCIDETERKCMNKYAITLLLLLTAPSKAEPNLHDSGGDQWEHIAQQILQDILPTPFKDIDLPEVPGKVEIKKLKELHWNSDHIQLNFHTDVLDPNSINMNYQTDHTQSILQMDSSGEFQFTWHFKKTFGGP